MMFPKTSGARCQNGSRPHTLFGEYRAYFIWRMWPVGAIVYISIFLGGLSEPAPPEVTRSPLKEAPAIS